MRDDDLAFVELVQRELGDVRWPEPVEIRARARRRSRRTAVAALAVLTVASAAAVVVAARPDPSEPPSIVAGSSPASGPWSAPPATGEPEPTPPRRSPMASPAAEVPLDVLLQPTDVKAKTEAPVTEAGLGEGVQLDAMLLYCRKLQGQSADWEPSRYSRSLTLLRNRPGEAEQPPSDVLLNQDVYRVAPDVAQRIFAEMAEVLAPCRQWRSSGPILWQGKTISAQAVHSWEEVDRNFAGDESVLLRHTVTQARNLDTGKPLGEVPDSDSTAVVRVGDLISVIRVGGAGAESDLRRLAGVAADRMCVAANPRC
ncbi:hypothetical protein [Micromonospora sp. CB01531]|uniref:hypothetical protein n=1 Tax=Micromonospora sp. CB01531 TaxID=1718947 RepID=UPI00093E73A5|nr:hypothetical protein [Micromonospora sp. CB01531]OKI42182.1 hypothetical protein A6A27_12675 [Micromonospora sp. CB01531]